MKKLLKKILAVGLAATMTLGMAVTSFATSEDPATPTTPAAPSATVWVNGKDVKANAAKKIAASKAKTAEVKLADLTAASQTYTFAIEDEYKDKVEATLTSVTKEGTLVYKKMVTQTSPNTLKVAILDSSIAEGTYTYVAATEDAEAYWRLGSDDTKKLDPEAVKITGAPAAGNTFKVELAWDKTGCAGVTDVSVKSGASLAEDTVVKVVQQVREGLSTSLPAKTKYLMAVTGTDVTTYTDAFPSNKAVKSNMAKVKFDKKTSNFVVTAGKEKGTGFVWVAEYNSTKKAITAWKKFALTVNMAPAKFSIQIPAVAASEGVEAKDAITKKTTVKVGETFNLAVAIEKPTAEEVTNTTKYTWTVKVPKNAKAEDVVGISNTVTGNTATGIKITKLPDNAKAANYTITCTNNESQKKATFKVTVVNNIKEATLPAIPVKNAYEEKQTATVKLGATAASNIVLKTDASGTDAITKLETTDKIKVYVSSETTLSTKDANGVVTEGQGFTFVSGEKKDTFKLTAKSKEVSAKIAKDGSVTVTAKKGTMPGTRAKLILVVTHKNNKIDVYESVITVGNAATAQLTSTTYTYTVQPGKTQQLALSNTGIDVVWTTNNKSVATVDSKGKVTAKKEGEATITATSGDFSVDFTITVAKPEAASNS